MVFSEVFDSLLAGCGLNKDRVRGSKHFRQLVRGYKTVLNRLDKKSMLWSRGMIGPLASGEVFNREEGNDDPVNYASGYLPWQTDPRVFASIVYAGEALLQAAAQCLPNRPSRRETYRLNDRTLKNRTFTELARGWRTGSSAYRSDVLQLAVDSMSSSAARTSEEVQQSRYDQPATRVLPKLYGRWIPGVEHSSNCLGKAQLMAAFGRMAGAKMLALIPIQPLSRDAELMMGIDSYLAFNIFRSAGISLTPEREQGLLAICTKALESKYDLNFPHYATAFQIKPNVWIMADAGWGITATLPGSWDLDRAYSLLQELKPVTPGMSFLAEDPLRDRMSRPSQSNNEIAEAAKALNQLIIDSASKNEIIVRLIDSKVLSEVLKGVEFGPSEMDPNSPTERKAVCALLEHLYTPQADKSKKPSPKHLWFAFGDRNAEQLAGLMTDAEAREALSNLLYRYVTHSLRTQRDVYQSQRYQRFTFPSQMHIGLVEPTFGTATLSHLGTLRSSEDSDKVQQVLGQHVFYPHQLLNAVGRLVRMPEAAGPVEIVSAAVLRRLSFRLPDADLLLKNCPN